MLLDSFVLEAQQRTVQQAQMGTDAVKVLTVLKALLLRFHVQQVPTTPTKAKRCVMDVLLDFTVLKEIRQTQ